mgnify:CR=1 FL=1
MTKEEQTLREVLVMLGKLVRVFTETPGEAVNSLQRVSSKDVDNIHIGV